MAQYSPKKKGRPESGRPVGKMKLKLIAAAFLVTSVAIKTTCGSTCGGTDERAFSGSSGLVTDNGSGPCSEEAAGCDSAVGFRACGGSAIGQGDGSYGAGDG